MTDMRATERLLEVIAEQGESAGQLLSLSSETNVVAARNALHEMRIAADELRRRGDTLVRRDDLLRVLESMAPQTINPSVIDSLTRLEIALGGKLR